MKVQKTIASFFGIGYIPFASGTIAALVTLLLWIFFYEPVFRDIKIHLLICLLLFIVGIYVSNKTEHLWGHDSNRIVIDEVLGMCISLLFLPHKIWIGITAFVVFRVLDIWKPLYIKKLEKLNGGLGVMSDDLLAGIYTLIIVFSLYKLVMLI